MRRRGAVAVGACRDLDRAARPSCMPATMCWSPTAPTDRRAISAKQILDAARRHHDLLRSADRRGDRRADPAEHAAVYLESPGSLTFEMQDVPAIAKAAHDKGALVLMDNTWATPLYFRPLDHGVDLVIQAGTKYIGGHSDVMLGTVSANAATRRGAEKYRAAIPACVKGPTTSISGLRGLRTLAVRLDRHYRIRPCRGALARSAAGSVAHAASGAAEPSRPRDLEARFHRRLGAVQHGAQAGAAEGGTTPSSIRSNCSASAPRGAATKASPSRSTARRMRTATRWEPGGPTVRFHIGLEAVEDLIADLERGFAALAAAS